MTDSSVNPFATVRSLFSFLLMTVLVSTLFCGGACHQRQCYSCFDQSYCYFLPKSNFLMASWTDADEMCRSENATLPIVLNEVMHDDLAAYISALNYSGFQLDKHEVWMGGRQVREQRNNTWRWLNGKSHIWNDTEEDNPVRIYATLSKELGYMREFVLQNYHYVCQHFGASCDAPDAIDLKSGCLLVDSQDPFDVFESRNRCLRSGGDLAVIDSDTDRRKFSRVFDGIEKSRKLWIGLRKRWWMWRGRDSEVEMKYSNWGEKHGYNENLDCIILAFSLSRSRWEQKSCDYSKPFVVCQGEFLALEKATTIQSGGTTHIIGLVVGISILAVIIVVAVVTIAIQRKRTRANSKAAEQERSYQHLVERSQEQVAPGIQAHCATLQQPKVGELQETKTRTSTEHYYDYIDAESGKKSDVEVFP